MRAEQALSKVEESLRPSKEQADPESISDEERFMFRKLGLRMKAFLLLGITFLHLPIYHVWDFIMVYSWKLDFFR